MSENFYLTGESESTCAPYHYRACGLDSIYLLNGFDLHEHDGDAHVSIKDIDGLHLAIGKHLVMHRKALAPREIRFLRKTMGKSQAELAEELGVTSQTVARWEKGEHDISGAAEKLLRAIFLAQTAVGEEELGALRRLLSETLSELDARDEVRSRPVQFQLTDHWVQDEAA